MGRSEPVSRGKSDGVKALRQEGEAHPGPGDDLKTSKDSSDHQGTGGEIWSSECAWTSPPPQAGAAPTKRCYHLLGSRGGARSPRASPGSSRVLSLSLGLQQPYPTRRVCPGPGSRGRATWPEETPLWTPSLSAEPPVVLASQAPPDSFQFLQSLFCTRHHRGPEALRAPPEASAPGWSCRETIP